MVAPGTPGERCAELDSRQTAPGGASGGACAKLDSKKDRPCGHTWEAMCRVRFHKDNIWRRICIWDHVPS
eukprot:9030718-Karenia_brevis.AAC.1